LIQRAKSGALVFGSFAQDDRVFFFLLKVARMLAAGISASADRVGSAKWKFYNSHSDGGRGHSSLQQC
jgi:hypothetical protein